MWRWRSRASPGCRASAGRCLPAGAAGRVQWGQRHVCAGCRGRLLWGSAAVSLLLRHGADGESRVRPPGGRIVRFATFLGQPRQLTSRGASVSAAADDTNCAAANVENKYFIVASVYGRPVNGLSTWYMCCAGWLAQSEAQRVAAGSGCPGLCVPGCWMRLEALRRELERGQRIQR